MKRILTFIFSIVILAAVTAFIPGRDKQAVKYGALAVDRDNGFYYGFSYDQETRAAAESRALAECRKRGGEGSVVLVWQGSGCGAYRTINGTVGTAYGWGVAATQAEADVIATRECLKRSNGKPASNYVWACNSSGSFKELYNAGNSDNGGDKPEQEERKDQFSFNGRNYEASGDCPGEGTASLSTDDESFILLITNLPSGGNRSVNANFYTEGCTSCLSIQVTDLTSSKTYIATSGSLSRNGNTVTFNINVKAMMDMASGDGLSYKVTGKFVCEE